MNRAERRRQQKQAGKAAKRNKPIEAAPEQQTLRIQQTLDHAVQHHNAGRLTEAEGLYREILQADRNQPDALHMLGVIAYQVGNHDTALGLITKALTMMPGAAGAHSNLGNVLLALGKLDEAVARHQKALAIAPDYAQAHYNLGNAFQALGKLDESVASYHKALAINPDYAEALSNLGNLFQALGKLDESVASYHKALAINPDYAEAHSNLGNAFWAQGKMSEAFASHRRAIALNPGNDSFWAGLAESLETLSFAAVDDSLLRDLLLLLEKPRVRPSFVIQPILSALRHDPDFARVLALTDSGKPEIEIVFGNIAGRLSSVPLFLRIMALCSLHDLEVERMLIHLRRAMLGETMAGKAGEKGLPFSVALALQCFTNEYVFPESDEETAAVEALEQQIAALVEKQQEVPPALIATLGAYRPLYDFPWARQFSGQAWPGGIGQLVERHILEPQEEQSLRSAMPRLTPIENAVSQAVREQYEENPYPRWVNTGIRDKGGTIAAELQRAPLRLDLEDYESPERPEILIAGCGTGQHALATASRFANARVLALDLSLSSLCYARRMTEKLGISNIEYAQADILELGSLDRRFDLIESVGVLHHLGDPLAGWRVLVGLLRPGGLMKIGLYSETARQDIVWAREMIAEMGYSASVGDIRRCRRDIIALAEGGDREAADICHRRNFFSLSECRDLLFHIQEHRFTLPQIEAALETLDLDFLGFEMRDGRALNKFKESHPNGRDPTSLSLWHAFELANPDTFQGMYQFWTRKL